MDKVVKTCFASVVSELQQSDIYMTVKARIFETPKANLNGARVTLAFLNEIVENEEKYIGLPLVADVKALANGRYDHLGHLYDARTGQFHTTQIGSFYKFEKEDFEGGSYLIGYARVMKRNKAVCKAIAELFADGALKFSFEIACGQCQELEDGTILIDASENNFLEGAAIVTFPACEDAVALELVAECDRIADDLRKGENEMTDVNTPAEVIAEEEPVAETTETENVQKTAEEEDASCKKEKNAEEEDASCKKEENAEETAAVYVTERHEERSTVDAYDDQTHEAVVQTVTVETTVSHVEDEAELVVAADGDSPTDPDAGDDDAGEETEEEVPNEANEPEKKTAEELIAELTEKIDALSKEVAELKAQPVLVASNEKAEESINPFIGSIEQKSSYSLLEPVGKTNPGSYTLI